MQDQKDIIGCYDSTAKKYAEKFIDELNHKHLDRILLHAFTAENAGKGRLIDLGCGPGQTTRFLYNAGLRNIIGTDISPEMINIARHLNPGIDFETADILNLSFPDQTFGSAIAFYSIVHFDYSQLSIAFAEINRVLKVDGQLLFSFHIGDNIVHLDEFLGYKVNIDFTFFETEKIIPLLTGAGFEIVDIIERQHYTDIEYPSKRAYIWVKKNT